ncbi:hypothetical protein GCM10017784_33820 [Deinococcus indicus]|nr:hypothetical protein GCM10017784_33820 [Deinococcus indicus]
MSATPAYTEVVRLNSIGQYADALALLDTLEDSGIHLWLRGWSLYHLGHVEEGHAAFERAEPLLSGKNLGRMLMDRAVLYGHDRRFARAYDLHVRAWQHGRQDAIHQALVLYNLGWQHLSRMNLVQARARLFEAMEAAERLTGTEALERTLTRTCLSTLERLSGNPQAALRRALWALELPSGHRNERLPWRAKAMALRHLGRLTEARDAQVRAVELSPPGPYLDSEVLMLGLIDRLLGRPVELETLRANALAHDAVRLDLHLADEARRDGRPDEALTRLNTVIGLDEPYPLRDEAPSLPHLFTLGRQAGLVLPETVPDRTARRADLRALGVPELKVNGQPVPVTSARAFAVLTYLAMYGQTGLSVLGSDVLPGVPEPQVRARVRAAVGVLARWLGDPEAVTLQGNLLVLSPEWELSVDASDVLAGHGRAHGAFLPGLYTDWTGQVQDLLDQQARPEALTPS